ncbi:MAG: ParB/RepB/Spo0J family partition protein [Acidobacteria bacterium]|nr:MAG: ParB/RepB/Spo0J family partition protein [Acidobacteriota bacterium]
MSSRRRGLGRGLDALLGGEPLVPAPAVVAAGGLTTLPVESLEPNRFQPRNRFDESSLEELAASIRSQGVVQPLVVTDRGDGRYTIIAGERRWRAARRAGLAEVPVVVREVADDQQLLELALVENLQRADLNAIEEAEAYRMLAQRFGLSQEQIGERVGKSRPAITNALRLLRLPAPVQDLLRDGRLTPGQARPLLALPDETRQIELAEEAVEKGLTARQLERVAADSRPAAERPKGKTKPELDVHTRAAQDKLTRALQTRVDIVRRRRGGLVRIHFHSEEELIRLFDHLTQGKGDE